MPFDTFTSHLKKITEGALAYCKDRYGGQGLQIEKGINNSINWRPTFFLKPEKFRIIAVEVDDNLYPEALRGAELEIGYFDFPISVFQVCSLGAYQDDHKQGKTNLLRKHGFGIITVDDDGRVSIQSPCIPLLQHISTDQFNTQISTLPLKVKVAFKNAYDVYRTNEGQGVQLASQIVEGLVRNIAVQAAKKNVITKGLANKFIADAIDALYTTKEFTSHRAALGGARGFINEFRNPASHPPKNAKEAAEKIRKCKRGFLSSIEVCHKLHQVATSVGYTTKIFTT